MLVVCAYVAWVGGLEGSRRSTRVLAHIHARARLRGGLLACVVKWDTTHGQRSV